MKEKIISKLKTLKELDNTKYEINYENNTIMSGEIEYAVSRKDLKEEAVKWLKELIKNEDDVEYEKIELDDQSQVYCVIRWIKYFFNITEDDLK